MSNIGNQDALEGPSTAAPTAATTNARPGETAREAFERRRAELILKWDQEDDTHNRIITQAEYCTDGKVKLPAVSKILEGPEGFDDFEEEVINILTGRSYELLIDYECMRPDTDDPKANYWKRESKAIKFWLGFQVSPTIYRNIKVFLQKTPKFADEMWKGIRIATQNDGIYREINVMGRFYDQRSNSYKTLDAFIDDFMKLLENIEREGIEMDWKCAILAVLGGANYFDEKRVDIISRKLGESPPVYNEKLLMDVIRDLSGL